MEVVMSKIKATAPPWSVPPALHSSGGTTNENTVRASFGLAADGVHVTDSILRSFGIIAS